MPISAQNTAGYRTMINNAEISAGEAKIFLSKMNGAYNTTKKPIFLALVGVGNFFQAKHSFNPINKMTYFNRGRKMLDEAVKLDNHNLEIRFLRFISQKKIPRILGYYHNLKEDENFLRLHIHKSDDAELVKEIKRNLK